MSADGDADRDVLRRFPAAYITHHNKAYFRELLRHRLCASRCRACGHLALPVEPVCPRCQSAGLELHPVSGRGSIYLLAWPRPGGGPAERPLAVVALDDQEGLRVCAPVVAASAGDIALDRRVELVWLAGDGAPEPAFSVVTEAGPDGR